MYTILSALGHVEMQKIFGEDGDPVHHLFFGIKFDLYITDNMDRLQKLLVLGKDQSLTTDSFSRVVETFVASILF